MLSPRSQRANHDSVCHTLPKCLVKHNQRRVWQHFANNKTSGKAQGQLSPELLTLLAAFLQRALLALRSGQTLRAEAHRGPKTAFTEAGFVHVLLIVHKDVHSRAKGAKVRTFLGWEAESSFSRLQDCAQAATSAHAAGS